MPITPSPKVGELVELWIEFLVDQVTTLSLPGDTTAGTFTLTLGDDTTDAIPWDASSSEVREALEELAEVGPGGVIAYGGPLPASAVSVQFIGKRVGKRRLRLTATEALTPAGDATLTETQSGGNHDADTVSAEVIDPAGDSSSITLTKMGTGIHKGTFVPAAIGLHVFEATGVFGTGDAIGQETFTVEAAS